MALHGRVSEAIRSPLRSAGNRSSLARTGAQLARRTQAREAVSEDTSPSLIGKSGLQRLDKSAFEQATKVR